MKKFLRKIIPSVLVDACWHFPRAVLAHILYGFPSRRLVCIAVAGTKGKTSTAYFLHDILQHTGTETALFSTAGGKIKNSEFLNTWKMTTPSPFALQHFLARARRMGCTHTVIEVSSHALRQHRVWGIPFTIVVITNLDSDHLEYHATANEYRTLHTQLPSPHTRTIIINAADRHSALFSSDKRTISFSHTDALQSCIKKLGQWWAPLQTQNIVAAWSAAQALNKNDQDICDGLMDVSAPPGRFEEIRADQQFKVIVDYAHSPESLSYFFSHIRPLVRGRLIVVFGACGDRDASKRPVMGALLETYADHIVLTTDDPYSEDPKDIARQVAAGIKNNTPSIILDRKEAIAHALSYARGDDCVCILGKGAEQLQIFKNKKIPWDDRAIARECLTRARA
jgi:UDP-N-acetylmuramoyl-L-alanyl-D-glutamate--2,6-diaminopimelate ligase